MFRKTIVALFALTLFSSVLFAQKSKTQNLPQWEYLEVAGIHSCYTPSRYPNCRRYNYLTTEVSFEGRASLEWMKMSGWELVGIAAVPDSSATLFFKRPLDKIRTENEIAELKKDYEAEIQAVPIPPKSALTDLDEQEFQQKLADFNKNQEVQLRTALEQTKNLPLRIISVESKSSQLDRRLARAEIVLDATAVLLKDGKNYRSSEADQYYQETVKRLLENIGLRAIFPLENSAKGISKGQTPLPIGKSYNFGSDVNLSISVVVTADGQHNILVQGVVQGEWIKK